MYDDKRDVGRSPEIPPSYLTTYGSSRNLVISTITIGLGDATRAHIGAVVQLRHGALPQRHSQCGAAPSDGGRMTPRAAAGSHLPVRLTTQQRYRPTNRKHFYANWTLGSNKKRVACPRNASSPQTTCFTTKPTSAMKKCNSPTNVHI